MRWSHVFASLLLIILVGGGSAAEDNLVRALCA